MLDSLRERIRWNLAYMKEMVIGDALRFKGGKFVQCASLSDVGSKTLRDYYIDYRSVVTHYHLWVPMTALDENGVARADYSIWGKHEIGIQYYPIAIAIYALGNFQLFLDTGESKYKQAFFAQVDWLMKNAWITVHGTAVWEVHYNFTPFNLDIPWVSAMAQGQIISVLLRAYILTAEKEYLATAERALQAFRFSTIEGGVTWRDDEGFSFYEEYPSEPPCHVLNGHIWAMFGLYDFYRVTDSQEALDLFSAGVATMKRYLPYYDTGFWSKHDLLRQPGYTAIRYHQYHIELLKVLYGITRDSFFEHYVRRWSSYLNPWRKACFAIRLARLRLRQYIDNRVGSG